MCQRSPAQLLHEARSLWSDEVSFTAALSVALRDELPRIPEPKWSYLTTMQQREIAERLLERAVSRERASRRVA